MRSFPRISRGIILLVLTLWTAACGTALAPASTPGKTSEPTSEPSLLATEQAQAAPLPTRNGGLTYEEMRSRIPPAPLDFNVTVPEEGVRLDWSLPPSVNIPHDYSDMIIHYNIYRRTEDQAGVFLLATSEGLSFVDGSVASGKRYYYSVSAVHEGPLEGERTDEISVTIP